MVMAAGLGTRLRPFTEITPKAFLPLMGIPIAQFALDSLREAGVSDAVVNIHHHAEAARERLSALDANGIRLQISDESDLLLGSAGGIRKAFPLLGGGPFFLLNADVLCDLQLSELGMRHRELRERHGVSLTLALLRKGPAGGRYREIFHDESSGLVTGFGTLEEGKAFYSGCAVIEPEALRDVPLEGPAEFVPTILEPAIREGKAGALVFDGKWLDIGSPALWLDAHVELIESLETGLLPIPWKERIEKRNRRIAPGIWVEKGEKNLISVSGWAPPAYWSASGSHPVRLGPREVLYGARSAAPTERSLRSGIGYGGKWVEI